MKHITKYEANDGEQFETQDECLVYEKNYKDAEKAMSLIAEKPKGCAFSNGEGYLQHDEENLKEAKIRLLCVYERFCDHRWIQDTKKDNIHPSFVARIIGEYEGGLSRHWYRFMCIDKEFREWGQPFYADIPEQANMFCINDEKS